MTSFRSTIDAHLESHARYNGVGNMKMANAKLLEIVRALVDRIESMIEPSDKINDTPKSAPVVTTAEAPVTQQQPTTTATPPSSERDIAMASPDILVAPKADETPVPVEAPEAAEAAEAVDHPDATSAEPEPSGETTETKSASRARKKADS